MRRRRSARSTGSFRTESEANVTFSTERGRFTAEITIKNNGTFFRAHETTSDMYASVDSAVATIERQIRKNKTRLAKKLRDGAFEREVQPDFLPADDAARGPARSRSCAASASPSSP